MAEHYPALGDCGCTECDKLRTEFRLVAAENKRLEDTLHAAIADINKMKEGAGQVNQPKWVYETFDLACLVCGRPTDSRLVTGEIGAEGRRYDPICGACVRSRRQQEQGK